MRRWKLMNSLLVMVRIIDYLIKYCGVLQNCGLLQYCGVLQKLLGSPTKIILVPTKIHHIPTKNTPTPNKNSSHSNKKQHTLPTICIMGSPFLPIIFFWGISKKVSLIFNFRGRFLAGNPLKGIIRGRKRRRKLNIRETFLEIPQNYIMGKKGEPVIQICRKSM